MGNGRSICGSKNRANFDPDEKWSNLYREKEKNNIYRWVGVRNGGELIKLYERDGEEGVLRFAEEKIAPLLFDDGINGPHLIKLQDYLKWKKAMNVELGVQDSEAESFEARFKEHEALWKLNKRGVDGETIVHLLLSREQQACHEIARILLKRYPGLCNDVYLGNEMFGQTALHLAIVHDDYETVQLLLKCGADVNARANGNFFLPEVWKHQGKTTDYTGWAYYGEYPLAFAACFGNKDIYDLLVEHGADPNKRDNFGNTILHMCVISNSSSMYSYAVRHWTSPANPDVVNEAGYTPLTLATKLGRKQIFDQMLELSKVEFYRFSDMACSAYPLNTLDTIRYDGTTNYDSALMTVINGTTPEHLDMIGSEVIERLLADKWTAFAKVGLYKRMCILVAHLFCISLAAGLRPTEPDRLFFDMINKNASEETTTTLAPILFPLNPNLNYFSSNYVPEGPRVDDWFRLFFEIGSYLFTLYYYYQQVAEVKAQGIISYIRNMLTTPAKVIYTIANLMILLCLPCRFFRLAEFEEALLAFAVPGAFIYGLFFARSFKLTGPFVQMIYSMIAGDFALFAIISAIFMIPFSFVLYFLGADIEAKQQLPEENDHYCKIKGYDVFTFNTRTETFITLFRAMLGGYDYEELFCSNYELFTKVLFVMYMFVMPIMMINILIAMMGNTYTTVIDKAEKAWRRQYAQIIMNLERSLSPNTLVNHMLNYSIKLYDSTTEGEGEIRGLTVFKKTDKTRAGARRNATLNWISLGTRVMHCVSRMGVEQAIVLLHGHNNLEGILMDEEKRDRRPMTRHRPTTIWRRGNTEIARIDIDPPMHGSRPGTQNSSMGVSPDTTHYATPFATPAATMLDVVSLAQQQSKRVRVRGTHMLPSVDLPNMPGGAGGTGSAPLARQPLRSAASRTA